MWQEMKCVIWDETLGGYRLVFTPISALLYAAVLEVLPKSKRAGGMREGEGGGGQGDRLNRRVK